MQQQVWLITGVSSGLGQALAAAAIEAGHFVWGSFRQQAQADAFERQYPDRAKGIQLDITQPADIERAVDLIQQQGQGLHVLVNNAGYGMAGAVEETSMAAARHIMETNFFGPLQLTRAFLPLLRQQRSGHIIQISSHGGVKAFAGFGLYNASKFALEGMSEALAAELAPLGIKVTLVEPGPFRTGFAGSSFVQAQEQLADYADTAGAFRQRMQQVHGQQEGDPQKAAHIIVAMAQQAEPPLRQPLGKIALLSINSKIDSLRQSVEAGGALAASAVF
jgi:NAD(P)-dependent dehydrogenase (short-subunit alcohol dehydrogenase family)